MDQQLFQILTLVVGALLAVVGFCIAWWVNNLWSMVRSQQEQLGKMNTAVQEQIGALSLKVAEHYATRTQLDASIERLNLTIEKIFDKLDEIQKEVRRG